MVLQIKNRLSADEKYAFIGRYTNEETFVSPVLGKKLVQVSTILV